MRVGEPQILSVHRNRKNAREVERDLQAILDTTPNHGHSWRSAKHGIVVPAWARGIKVERVGVFQRVPGRKRKLGVQWCVVATWQR